MIQVGATGFEQKETEKTERNHVSVISAAYC